MEGSMGFCFVRAGIMGLNGTISKILYHIKQGDALLVFKNLMRLLWKRLAFRCHQLVRDIGNRVCYGKGAPQFCELIWVDASEITKYVGDAPILRLTGMHRDWASGCVVEWDSLHGVTPLMDELRIKKCTEHWRNGVSWDELGYIDMMKNVPRHKDDSDELIRKRFAMLDQAFDDARKTGMLKTRRQIDASNFREDGGVLVHIAKGGEPVFGGNGFHRLAIAKVLSLKRFPACLGVVDEGAIPLLERFR
jgi:hypothetical protein